MPRLARVVAPGFPHHVTQRGSRRQQTFFCDADYRAYLALLIKLRRRFAVEIWAYCLMPNHIHLIAVPARADGLAKLLQRTHQQYARRINLREGWQGHLWQERFHSFVMDEAHLLSAVRYVEQNPVRAGLCVRPEEWLWSSARAHVRGISDPALDASPALEQVRDWSGFLARDVDASTVKKFRELTSTGRPSGNDAFVARLEELTGRRLKKRKPGRKPRPGD